MHRILVSLILISASPVNAASFNCKKARNNIEKTICSHPDLSELDAKAGDSWSRLLKFVEDNQWRLSEVTKDDIWKTESVKDRQRSWLKSRNKQCDKGDQTQACLTQSLRSRHSELEKEYRRALDAITVVTDWQRPAWKKVMLDRKQSLTFSFPDWGDVTGVGNPEKILDH